MKKAIIYVVAFVLIQAMAQTGVMGVSMLMEGQRAATLSAGQALLSTVLSSIITIAIFLRCRWAVVSRHYLLTKPWSVLLWTALAAIGTVIPSMMSEELMPQWPQWIQDMEEQSAQLMAQLMMQKGGYAVIALLVPIAEELVFRGAALRALLAWKPELRWGMIALSALLFGLVHLNPTQAIHAFAIGLLLGWMYERTGSIVPGIVFHCVNNTAAYLLFRLYPDPSIELTDVLGSTRMAALAVGYSLLVLLPALYQLHLRMHQE